jgi:hypothetical protein
MAAENVPKWKALQRWRALACRPVIVPFAPVLAKMIPPVAVHLRQVCRGVEEDYTATATVN